LNDKSKIPFLFCVNIEGASTKTQQPDTSIVQEDEQPTQLSETSIVQEDDQLLPPNAVQQPSASTEQEDDDDESPDLAIHPVEGEIPFIICAIINFIHFLVQ
jgi:hypothetical protein